MNILFLVPYVPNLIRVRPYNLIRNLSKLGHNIKLLTLWSSQEEIGAIKELENDGIEVMAARLPKTLSYWNCLKSLPTNTPLQAVYCWNPLLAKYMIETVRNQSRMGPIDVVHIEHLRGAKYGVYLKEHLEASGIDAPPIVWDSVDSISHLFRQTVEKTESRFSRLVTNLELGRTEEFEQYLVDQFDKVLVTSKVDKGSFEAFGASENGKTVVLTNGVDLNYFTPNPNEEREPATIIVSGKLSYHANVSMVLYLLKEIMPLIWRLRPDIRVWVVGKDPPGIIREYNQHPQIEVTGTVPDLRLYLQRAAVAVAPITYGAGIQNKVLEAMACSTPVVCTSKAVSALEFITEKEVVVKDSPEEFAGAVLKLLDNVKLSQGIGEMGRRYVEKHHDWANISIKLENIYRQLLESNNPN